MEAKNMRFEYRLVSLPPEVITPITDYLNGEHITRLYLSGDMELIHLLTTRGGVRSFRVKFNRFYQCCIPPLVYMLPYLRYLVLSCELYLQKHSPYPDWNLYKLPSSLKEISIELWTPDLTEAHDLTVEPYVKPLSVLFPDLESISPVLLPSTLDSQQLSLLPPLIRLDLNKYPYMKSLDLDLIQHLPRSLEELGLALPDDSVDWSNDPLFPPYITSLKLENALDSACFQYLPRSLTLFHFRIWDRQNKSCQWNEEHFSLLPTNLKTFFSQGLDMTLEMFRRLPRQLESMTCVGVSVSSGSLLATLNALPNTLTEISFKIGNLSALMSLEEVCNVAKLKLGRLKSCGDDFAHLFEQIGWFPDHIEDVVGIRHSFVGTLPDTIHSLRFSGLGERVPDDQTPFALPANLKLLRSRGELHPIQLDSILQGRFSLHTLCAPLFTHQALLLPPTLKSLTWAQKTNPPPIGEIFSLAHLPLLKTLYILDIPHMAPNSILFSTFPSSLKDIKILTSDPHIPSSELRHINSQRLPRLRELMVCGLVDLQDEDLANFPAGLTILAIFTLKNPQLTEDCLLKLPAEITKVVLDISFPVKVDHLAHLDKKSRNKLVRIN